MLQLKTPLVYFPADLKARNPDAFVPGALEKIADATHHFWRHVAEVEAVLSCVRFSMDAQRVHGSSGHAPTRAYVGGFSPILRSQALKNLRVGQLRVLEQQGGVAIGGAVLEAASATEPPASGRAGDGDGNPPPAAPLTMSETEGIPIPAVHSECPAVSSLHCRWVRTLLEVYLGSRISIVLCVLLGGAVLIRIIRFAYALF